MLLLVLVSWGCQERTALRKESRVAVLPYYNDPSFTPTWLEENSDSIRGMHRIPNFELINQLGDTITEHTFADKIYVADFFFTSCPGICPKMTANMQLVQEAFESDQEIILISHSVTPLYDSVPVLKRYADTKGVQSGKWHLVTGDRSTIYDLGHYAYFVDEDLGLSKEASGFLHTENFILVDKRKHIRGIYNGLNKTAIAQLIADIKTLKAEY